MYPWDKKLFGISIVCINPISKKKDEVIDVEMGVLRHNIFHQSVKELSSITYIGIRVTWELCVYYMCVHVLQ